MMQNCAKQMTKSDNDDDATNDTDSLSPSPSLSLSFVKCFLLWLSNIISLLENNIPVSFGQHPICSLSLSLSLTISSGRHSHIVVSPPGRRMTIHLPLPTTPT